MEAEPALAGINDVVIRSDKIPKSLEKLMKRWKNCRHWLSAKGVMGFERYRFDCILSSLLSAKPVSVDAPTLTVCSFLICGRPWTYTKMSWKWGENSSLYRYLLQEKMKLSSSNCELIPFHVLFIQYLMSSVLTLQHQLLLSLLIQNTEYEPTNLCFPGFDGPTKAAHILAMRLSSERHKFLVFTL